MKAQFLVKQVRRYRAGLILISGAAIGESLATLVVPWLAGQMLGEVVAAQADATLGVAALLVVALIAVGLLRVTAAILSAGTSSRILSDLRSRTHDHVQRLSLSFHDSSRQGDLIALMSYEVNLLSDFLSTTLARAPAMIVTAIGAVALLFVLDPMLALFIPLLLPIAFVAMKLVGRRMRKFGEQMREAEAGVLTLAERHLAMLPAAKAFAVEDRLQAEYLAQVEAARRMQFSHARLSAVVAGSVTLVTSLAAVGLVALGGFSSLGADGNPARLFSFFLYVALLTRPIGELADFYGRYQWAGGTMLRLEAVMAEQEEPGYTAKDPVAKVRGAIRFERVSFSYTGREPALREVDLDIKPGEIVALTGDNGAGKSTLIHLLFRFYEPSAGRILVDGQDIASLQVQSLRRQMALVPQRALLFDGSVRENIAFGLSDPLDERVQSAARLAQADLFIERLPQGYDTQIGDHGVRLSGGQRQRIALARALVGDPPILVFDEATSMYDLDAELAFVEACQTAIKGRTVILVTHRPASLALADRIVTVSEGTISLA